MAKKAKADSTKVKKASKELKAKYENAKAFDLIENKVIDDSGVADSVTPEPVKVKKISPFDIIGLMFTNPTEFNNLTDSVLQQSSFMINRTFSIKYPLQAQFFNVNNSNGAAIVKFWQKFITAKEGMGTVPRFVYTGGSAKQKAAKVKTKADELNQDTIKEYCNFYHLSLKDFQDMLYFYNEQTVEDVENFEKKRSKSEQAKMFRSGRSTAKLDDED